MSREQLLAATFVELADTLDDDFDVLDFLQNLVDRSAEILEAAAVGLIMADPRGDLQLIASTTHAPGVLELIASAISEGPCREAFETGLPIVNTVPGEAIRRWPSFTATAAGLGYGSVQVLPMRIRTEVLGVIGLLYTDDESTFSTDDLAVGQALAGVATIGLLQERTPRQKELLAEQLQTALSLRVVIEQAKGVTAERAGVGVDEAFDLISSYARSARLRLSDVAAAVLEGSIDATRLRDRTDRQHRAR